MSPSWVTGPDNGSLGASDEHETDVAAYVEDGGEDVVTHHEPGPGPQPPKHPSTDHGAQDSGQHGGHTWWWQVAAGVA